MSYTYQIDGHVYSAGDYAKFAIFENTVVARPFALVQKDFPRKEFFNKHPDTGGRSVKSGRVMDCLCRIDAILRDKNDREYPLLTPIIPNKVLYEIIPIKALHESALSNLPDIFMRRIERWAINHRRRVKIGKLVWNMDYQDPFISLQKVYECIDTLLRLGLTESEIAEASKIVLASNTSPVNLVEPERLVGATFDIRSGQPSDIPICYEETGEIACVSIGTVAKLFKDHRLKNAELIMKGPIVALK